MKTAQPELRTGNDFRKYCSRNQGRAKVCAVPMSPRLLSHKIRNTTSTNTNTNTKTNTKTNTWTNTGKNINTNANTHRRYWNKCLRESFRRSHVSQASESHVPEADTYVQFCTVMNHYQGRWLQGLRQSVSVNMSQSSMFCKIFWNILPTSAIIRMDKIHIAFLTLSA